MRRWNLPQVNTKVMCAVLTAAMVMTGFTACGGSTTASAASTEASENKETIAPESTTESTESSEEKVESYLGQITAIDGNVISVALAEKPEAPNGEAPTGVRPPAEKSRMARLLTATAVLPTAKPLQAINPMARLLTATVALPMVKPLPAKHPTEKHRTVRNPRKIC